MAASGHNGRNESFIGFSYGMSLSFLDQNGNEIPVKNTLEPIQMFIPRDPNLLDNEYMLVNVSSNSTLVRNNSQILPNAFVVYPTNASLHIQIKPENLSVGYLALVKFGSSPILDSLTKMYDFWQLLCPNSTSDFYQVYDKSTNTTDYFYLIFLDMHQVSKP